MRNPLAIRITSICSWPGCVVRTGTNRYVASLVLRAWPLTWRTGCLPLIGTTVPALNRPGTTGRRPRLRWSSKARSSGVPVSWSSPIECSIFSSRDRKPGRSAARVLARLQRDRADGRGVHGEVRERSAELAGRMSVRIELDLVRDPHRGTQVERIGLDRLGVLEDVGRAPDDVVETPAV